LEGIGAAVPRIGFVAERDGLHFPNSFANRVHTITGLGRRPVTVHRATAVFVHIPAVGRVPAGSSTPTAG